MKKMYAISSVVILLLISTLTSCKKKDEPAPVATNAGPAFVAGVSTSRQIFEGFSTSWRLTNQLSDSEGDSWTITRVTSSDTNILTAEIDVNALANPEQTLAYTGVSAGTATITLVVTDSRGAASTLNITVEVIPDPNNQ